MASRKLSSIFQEELENRLLEKEATLLEQLQAQKEGLILEKGKIEESLREAMEKAIEEKNTSNERQLDFLLIFCNLL
jgi:chaperonin cofactor prefoldin